MISILSISTQVIVLTSRVRQRHRRRRSSRVDFSQHPGLVTPNRSVFQNAQRISLET